MIYFQEILGCELAVVAGRMIQGPANVKWVPVDTRLAMWGFGERFPLCSYVWPQPIFQYNADGIKCDMKGEPLKWLKRNT